MPAIKNILSSLQRRVSGLRVKYKAAPPAMQMLGVILMLLGIVGGVWGVREGYKWLSRAAGETARIYFEPATATFPPNQTMKMMIDSGTTGIGFVKAVVTFNPAKVKLTGEITTSDKLKTVVEKTSMATANSTGQITIVLGLLPADSLNPPMGIFEIAQLPFGAATTTANQTDTLAFQTASMEMWSYPGNAAVAITGTNSTVSVNPSAGGVNFHMTPSTFTLPPSQTMKLMLNAGINKIGFVSVNLTFDPTKVRLAGEITAGTSLGTVVEKTSMATANSTGRISLVLALATADRDFPPTGDFELASIPLAAFGTGSNLTTTFSVDPAGMEVWSYPEQQSLSFTHTGATITVNPVNITATPTPISSCQTGQPNFTVTNTCTGTTLSNRITWSTFPSSCGFDTYPIQRCLGNNCTPDFFVNMSPASTQLTDNNVEYGKVYGYRMRAYDIETQTYSGYTPTLYVTANCAIPTPTPLPPAGGRLITNLIANDTAEAIEWSVRQNLQQNDFMYGDRPYIFQNLSQTLLGREWIRPAQKSWTSTLSTLASFQVTANSTVYVLFDDRFTTKPSWMNTWQDTGVNVSGLDPVGIGSDPIGTSNLATFSVYSKQYATGQTVLLGSIGDINTGWMYVAIARADAVSPTVTPTRTPTPIASPTRTPTPFNTPTRTPTPSLQKSGYIKVIQDSVDHTVGELFSVAISINTGGRAISSVTWRISYPYSGTTPELNVVDPIGTQATQIVPLTPFTGATDWTFSVNSVSRANGQVTIDFAAVNTSTAGYTSNVDVPMARIYFKANRLPAVNPTQLTFDPLQTKMLSKTTPLTDILAAYQNFTIRITSSSLMFSAQLQGVTKPFVTKSALLTLSSGGSDLNYNVSVVSDSAGIFRPSAPVELNGVNGGQSYDVYLKPEGYLRRKLGTITIQGGTNTLAQAGKEVLAGDFDGNNILNILDIGKILSVYTELSVPVTTATRIYDIDISDDINITDVAIVLINYTALQIYGD